LPRACRRKFATAQRELEYDFIVSPDGDANCIKLKFSGAERLTLDEQTGDLLLTARGREVRQHKPIAYQDVGGVRCEVAARYVRLSASTVGISVGDYDRYLPRLVLPEPLAVLAGVDETLYKDTTAAIRTLGGRRTLDVV
jgi:hypothetical protein